MAKINGKEIDKTSEVIHFLSKKWNLFIIKSISDWCKSFGDIEKNMVWWNPRILSQRLKELIQKWLVEKKIVSEIPLRAIYCLTKKWRELSKHINTLSNWWNKNL